MLVACGGGKPQEALEGARASVAKGDWATASVQLKGALQVNPDLGEARLLLGRSLLEQDQFAAALLELRKAREAGQPADLVVPLLARAAYESGDDRLLSGELASTRLADPQAQAQLQTWVAAFRARAGDLAGAQAAVQEALRAKPDHATAQVLKARLDTQRIGPDAALAVADGIVARLPREHDAWMLRGDILLFFRQDLPGALAAYRQAVQSRPRSSLAHAGVVGVLLRQRELEAASTAVEAMRRELPNHSQTAYFQALVDHALGKSQPARDRALALLKFAPDNPFVLQLAGVLEFESGSLLQAEGHLSKALQGNANLILARRTLAQTQLRSGQPDQALRTLAPAIQGAAPDPAALALAAQARLQMGDLQQAETLFAQAARLDPKDFRSRTATAVARVARGATNEGFAELDAIAREDTGVVAELAMLTTHLRARDFDKALAVTDAIERKQPGKPQAPHLRSRVHMARGDAGQARTAAEAALKADPAYYPALADLAQLDLAEGKPGVARQRFEQFLAKEPAHVPALVQLASLRDNAGLPSTEVLALLNRGISARPSDPLPRLALMRHHMGRRALREAQVASREALSALPEERSILEMAASVQAASGETQQALASLGKVAAAHPRDASVQVRMAEVQLQARNPAGARENLERALALAPDAPDVLARLVWFEAGQGRAGVARALARRVQERQPKSAAGFMLEGDAETALRNPSGAIAAYRRALALDPRSSDLAVRLHRAMNAGPSAGTEAVAFADRWLREQPEAAVFRTYLADVALQQKDYPTSERHYRVLTQARPGDALAWNNLAWSLVQQKKDGAVEAARRAVELRPGSPPMLDTYASALLAAGQGQQAAEVQRKAVDIWPRDPQMRLSLARILARNGDNAGARAQVEEIGRLNPALLKSPEVIELQKGL